MFDLLHVIDTPINVTFMISLLSSFVAKIDFSISLPV